MIKSTQRPCIIIDPIMLFYPFLASQADILLAEGFWWNFDKVLKNICLGVYTFL